VASGVRLEPKVRVTLVLLGSDIIYIYIYIYIYNDNNVIVVQEAHLNNGCLFIFIEDLQSYKYKYKTLQTLESKC
jgi:hypothetical protein